METHTEGDPSGNIEMLKAKGLPVVLIHKYPLVKASPAFRIMRIYANMYKLAFPG